MKFSLTDFLILSIILISSFSDLKAKEQVLSFSGAHFKSFNRATYSTIDGCISGVNFSNIDLPTESVITRLDLYIFSDLDKSHVFIRLFRQDNFNSFSSLIEEFKPLRNGYNLLNFSISNAYVVKNLDVFSLSIHEDESNETRVCGAKLYYLTEEVVFKNGFD